MGGMRHVCHSQSWVVYDIVNYDINFTARRCVVPGRFKWCLNMFASTLTLRRILLQVAMKLKLLVLLPQSTCCS